MTTLTLFLLIPHQVPYINLAAWFATRLFKLRQVRAINELVSFAVEDPIEDLFYINEIQINQPLRSWLADHPQQQ